MLCGYIAYILSYIIRIDTIYCITVSHLFSPAYQQLLNLCYIQVFLATIFLKIKPFGSNSRWLLCWCLVRTPPRHDPYLEHGNLNNERSKSFKLISKPCLNVSFKTKLECHEIFTITFKLLSAYNYFVFPLLKEITRLCKGVLDFVFDIFPDLSSVGDSNAEPRQTTRQNAIHIETCKSSKHFFWESRACKHVLKMQLLILD